MSHRIISSLSKNRAILNGEETDPVVGIRHDDPKALSNRDGGRGRRGRKRQAD